MQFTVCGVLRGQDWWFEGSPAVSDNPWFEWIYFHLLNFDEALLAMARLDPDQYRWVRLHDDSSPLYTVDYDQTVLGYDRDAGTFDMILRFHGNGGHCNRHRHVTTTSVLVLEGEQHLTDLLPGGETRQKVRCAGEHHLTTGDVHPHMERGGDNGALIFYGHHTLDGRMYELLDDEMNVVHVVTIDEMIASWENA